MELRYSQDSPILIKGDNDGSIMMAHNPQLNSRSKYGILTIQSCRDPEQTANALTKALPRPKHQRHALEIGLSSA